MLAGTLLAASDLVLPNPDELGVPEMFRSASTALPRLWDIAIVVAAVVFLILLLVGGLQYLTSAGNEDQSKKAKTLLLDAVIGLVIVVVAWPVGKWTLSQLGQGGLFANPAGQATLQSGPVGSSGLSSGSIGSGGLGGGAASQSGPGTSEKPGSGATQQTPGVSESEGTFDDQFDKTPGEGGSGEGDGEGDGEGNASSEGRLSLAMAFRDINSPGTPLANYGYSVVSGTDPYDVLSSGQSDSSGDAILIFPKANAGQTVRVVAAAGVSGSEVSTLYGPFTLPAQTGGGITVFAHPENDSERVTAYYRVVREGENLSGASVVVFDAGGKQLGKGSTNSYGLAAVTVPAAATTSVKVTYQGKVTTFNPVRSPSRNEYRVTVLEAAATK